MEISIIQAIFIGVWAAVAITGTMMGTYTATPIVYALGVGIILGDIQTAVIVGAAGQTVWLGFGISQGGVRPPDPIAPGIFATVVAIVEKHGSTQPISIGDAGIYIGYSIPVGILMQLLTTLLFTLMSPISEMAKKQITKGKFKMFKFLSHVTILVLMIVTFGFGLLVGVSANGIARFSSSIPDWLRTGLRVAGGMLPALGFALILKVMLKKEYIGFALLGYFLALVFEVISKITGQAFSVLALALTAMAFVLIIISIKKLAGIKEAAGVARNISNTSSNNENNKGGQQDGI
ncbi:PTS sugar transporter subunit IIC [Mycoplasmopsis fermentans]|uniref:PTS sugar transporter subunit IIC n=1 Tax=Mycoplasmopsis fermentans TaxID=2115 RepID=UPI000F031D54|nr:PTS sugar transporter subunit IIC [Mycoplasmopsis fermentans]RMX35290.1 PTS system sorbose-specific iic component family protein [Mycoplasmopsis fermentans MF-I2]RMX35428.1 PTS system sorbose-specific iic component family protein [Mycoplasmopsis fermentans MF-I1]